MNSIRERVDKVVESLGAEDEPLDTDLLAPAAAELLGDAAAADAGPLDLLLRLEDAACGLERELEATYSSVRAWRAATDMARVAGALEKFTLEGPAPRWNNLGGLLLEIPSVGGCASGLARAVSMPACNSLADLAASAAEYLASDDAAQLAESVETARGTLERRLREAWLAARWPGGETPDPVEVYSWMWSELLAAGPAAPPAAWLREAAAHSSASAARAGLSEAAELLDDAERATGYALLNLLPPAPSPWRMVTAAATEQLLEGELSRWYFGLFRRQPAPCAMVAAVLRAGRPLYYDRCLAHAILQYRVVRRWLRPGSDYFDILSALERNFGMLMDGWLLRGLWVRRLKTAAGWRDYLTELLDMHFAVPGRELVRRREAFLAERGAQTAGELLRRAGENNERAN